MAAEFRASRQFFLLFAQSNCDITTNNVLCRTSSRSDKLNSIFRNSIILQHSGNHFCHRCQKFFAPQQPQSQLEKHIFFHNLPRIIYRVVQIALITASRINVEATNVSRFLSRCLVDKIHLLRPRSGERILLRVKTFKNSQNSTSNPKFLDNKIFQISSCVQGRCGGGSAQQI